VTIVGSDILFGLMAKIPFTAVTTADFSFSITA
jgi:hypothetical protein